MIIALTGKQRSGKDTVAQYLVDRYGFTRKSLAEPVYQIARDFFGMKEKDRKLLISIGMAMRNIDPMVWVKYLWRWVEESGVRNVVIPDVRFLNEAYFFSSQGARIVRVFATPETRASRQGYTPEAESDVSETEMDEITPDYYLDNNGTFQELYRQVDRMMWAFGYNPVMKCGHVANARNVLGDPLCVICLGVHPGASEVDWEAHPREYRKAKCRYCGTITESSTQLPFYQYRPNDEYDSYYCGCRGWD